jgi:hypothetical protein
MKSYKIKKHYRLQPKIFGLDLYVGYVFVSISGVIILILFILFLFDINVLLLLAIGAGSVYLTKILCSYVSNRSIQQIEKMFFSYKITVIKNNSLKPFKINDL